MSIGGESGPSQGVTNQMKGKGEYRRGMGPSQGLANQMKGKGEYRRGIGAVPGGNQSNEG